MKCRIFLLVIALFLSSGFIICTCHAQNNIPATQSILDFGLRLDRVIITGQPGEQDISSLPKKGITHVVNVRTPEEMSDSSQVAFNEAKLMKDLNIAYINLPIGGEKYPYRPEVLKAFADFLINCKDTVLIHCKAGIRARWLYAAYEIKYLNKPVNEVMKSLERYGFWPLPIEKLMGIPLIIDRKEQ